MWTDSRAQNGDELSTSPEKNPAALDERLLRYRGVLSFVAYHVLSNHEEAEEAVRNCLVSASYNVPRFECEGAFRSWLVRILIDKASLIFHKKRT
jgi:DNA-directed RNA polymerase specialized sigma24 family protein